MRHMRFMFLALSLSLAGLGACGAPVDYQAPPPAAVEAPAAAAQALDKTLAGAEGTESEAATPDSFCRAPMDYCASSRSCYDPEYEICCPSGMLNCGDHCQPKGTRCW